MDVPFTLKVQTLQENIINCINNAGLPAYNVEIILQNICKTIDDLDKEEIEKYNEEIKKSKGEK